MRRHQTNTRVTNYCNYRPEFQIDNKQKINISVHDSCLKNCSMMIVLRKLQSQPKKWALGNNVQVHPVSLGLTVNCTKFLDWIFSSNFNAMTLSCNPKSALGYSSSNYSSATLGCFPAHVKENLCHDCNLHGIVLF